MVASKTALIAGATGLVGGELLKLLLADEQYSKVIVLTRKNLNFDHEKIEQMIVNFDALEDFTDQLIADQVFCCLGTTMKKAGSKEAFRKVDHEYPLKLAKLTKQNGCDNFMLISAIGADANSTMFYNKVKGEVERDIEQLGFESFNIIRPSLIVGDRNEARFLEDLMSKVTIVLNYLLHGSLKKYRSIRGSQIAKAMHVIAKSQNKGVRIYLSDELTTL